MAKKAEEKEEEAPAAEEAGAEEAKAEQAGEEPKAEEAKEVEAKAGEAQEEAKEEAPKAEEGKAEEAKEEAGEEAKAEEPEAEEEAPKEAPIEDDPVLTAKEIDKMNAPRLKEAALAYGGKIKGVHGMDKTQLVRALKEINDIPITEAKRASRIDRGAVKQQIKQLKGARDQHLEAKDAAQLRRVRKRKKALRRKLVRTA